MVSDKKLGTNCGWLAIHHLKLEFKPTQYVEFIINKNGTSTSYGCFRTLDPFWKSVHILTGPKQMLFECYPGLAILKHICLKDVFGIYLFNTNKNLFKRLCLQFGLGIQFYHFLSAENWIEPRTMEVKQDLISWGIKV